MLRARDFRHQAWSALSGNWGTMILITLIVSLISGACAGLSWIGIGEIVILLITGPLTLGVSGAFLKLIRGQHTQIGDMFEGFKNFGNAFLLSLLNSIFTALWSLLFIIPGIIATYRYSMSFYILYDNPGMDANTARKQSIELMRGNKWRLFCLQFSFIGWFLLCAITFGILALWVAPYYQAACAAFYREILREKNILQNGAPIGANGNMNGGNMNGGNMGADKSKDDGFGSTSASGEGSDGFAGANGSAFGTGYTPNPDIELDGTPTAQNPAQSPAKSDGDDSQPPINADDL